MRIVIGETKLQSLQMSFESFQFREFQLRLNQTLYWWYQSVRRLPLLWNLVALALTLKFKVLFLTDNLICEFNKWNLVVCSLVNYVWYCPCTTCHCAISILLCKRVRLSHVINAYVLTYLPKCLRSKFRLLKILKKCFNIGFRLT